MVVPIVLSAVTLGRRDKRHCGGSRLFAPQYCNPVFDLVEDESQDITMVGRPGVIVTGRRGGGRGMEMVPCIVRIRVAVPPTLPGVVRVLLSIVEFEVVVRVPTDRQLRLVDGCREVRRGKDDVEFQMAACIRDGRSGDLPRRLEPRLEELEDGTIDGGRAPAIACR